MQNASSLYETLFRNPLHRKEVKVNIAGTDYGHDKIVSLSTSGGIFTEPDIGTCASRQMDLTLREPGGIPKGVAIRVYARLRYESQTSEWIQKGEFFISTRKENRTTGNLDIHAFDAMRRSGDTWRPSADANWPMPQREAVESIARQMGVTVDSRTVLQTDFPVDYPVDEDGDMAMMDVLEGIAVSNAGNWIMSDRGELLLLRYGDIPPETNYLVTEYGRAIALGGVKILVG